MQLPTKLQLLSLAMYTIQISVKDV